MAHSVLENGFVIKDYLIEMYKLIWKNIQKLLTNEASKS